MFEDAEGFSELFKGYLPYYLLIALPIFIIISPTPVLSSHEFSAYRMHQYDLHGNTYGKSIYILLNLCRIKFHPKNPTENIFHFV